MDHLPELIFVYNADSGALNSLKDSLQKVLSPETYSCSLCQLTHGSFGELKAWKNFKKQHTGKLSFYHRDEFEKLFRSKWLPKYDFPVILYGYKEELGIFLDAQLINECTGLEDLIQQIKRQLKNPNYPWEANS